MQLRQGCTSCFLKAAALPASAAQLRALGYCASVFLNNTGYQVCAQQLAVIWQWNCVTEYQFNL